MQTQVSAHEQKIEKLENESSRHDVKETQDTIKIEVLATKQSAILEDVKEIKEDNKEIREEQKEQSKKLDAILQKLE